MIQHALKAFSYRHIHLLGQDPVNSIFRQILGVARGLSHKPIYSAMPGLVSILSRFKRFHIRC
jgi:hypothetical protein